MFLTVDTSIKDSFVFNHEPPLLEVMCIFRNVDDSNELDQYFTHSVPHGQQAEVENEKNPTLETPSGITPFFPFCYLHIAALENDKC